MKKPILQALIIGCLFCPLLGFAAGMSSLFDSGPTPQQSFHEAGHSAANSSNSADNLNQQQALQQAREIIAKAKNQQTQNKKPSAQAVSSDNDQSAKNNPTTSNNDATENELAQQLSTLNQTNLLFQQQTDQRLDNLAKKNKELQQKIAGLEQVMALLNQEITQYTAQLRNGSNLGLAGGSSVLKSDKSTLQYILYVGVALFLLVLAFMFTLARRKAAKQDSRLKSTSKTVFAPSINPTKNSRSLDNEEDDDTQDEYDFMGSQEGLPAKLDLARAYIAMEDYAEAQKVLDEILSIGNEQQKQEASRLQAKIPQH